MVFTQGEAEEKKGIKIGLRPLLPDLVKLYEYDAFRLLDICQTNTDRITALWRLQLHKSGSPENAIVTYTCYHAALARTSPAFRRILSPSLVFSRA